MDAWKIQYEYLIFHASILPPVLAACGIGVHSLWPDHWVSILWNRFMFA